MRSFLGSVAPEAQVTVPAEAEVATVAAAETEAAAEVLEPAEEPSRAEEATKKEGSNFEDSPFHPLLSIIPMQPAASCTCRSGDRNRPMRTLDELARPRPPNPWRGGGRGWGDLL